MRYLIIGLGIYGSNLAIDLTQLGHEVIGADHSETRVDEIKDYISAAYILDSTEEAAINGLPLKNVDVVIVAIGENFGASVKTVALLKKAGVKTIYARAIDELHQAILEGMQVSRIITPEQRAAKDLVYEMELGTDVKAMAIDKDHYVLNFRAPEYFFGLHYSDLASSPEKMFGLRLIAVCRNANKLNVLGINNSSPAFFDIVANPGAEVEEGDMFTCFGPASAYRQLFRLIN